MEDCVTYDARDAMLRYVDPGRRAQGVMTVSVRAPNFELDDIFLAFNGYKSSPPGISHSPFIVNVQQHKIFHEIFQKILEVELTSDTHFCVMDDLKNEEGNGKINVNPSKTESNVTSDGCCPF